VRSTNPSDYGPIRAAYAAMPVPTPVPPHEYEAARYVGHSGCVTALAVDGRGHYMATGGRDWSILLWDVTRPSPAIAVRTGGGGSLF
jgi:WD40 repeat protein